MTKGVVTCNLYKRKGSPSVNAEPLGYFVSGDEIEIEDVVLGETEADYYEGTPTWYRLTNGIYVWSGGVSVNLDEEVFKRKIREDRFITDKGIISKYPRVDLASMLALNLPIPPQDGKGVNIALVDSGIDENHPSLKASIIFKKNYEFDLKVSSHGSLAAGVLVGQDTVIKGISPASKVLDLRVAKGNGVTNDNAVYSALQELSNWSNIHSFQIINMSLDVTKALIPYLQPLINILYSKGVIILVAGNKKNKLTYISELQNVIPIGVFEKNDFESLRKNGFASSLVVSFLNEPIRSTSIFPSHDEFKNSSAYTVLVSGIVSRYLSSLNSTPPNLFDQVKSYLKSCAFSIKLETNPLPFKPYKT